VVGKTTEICLILGRFPSTPAAKVLKNWIILVFLLTSDFYKNIILKQPSDNLGKNRVNLAKS